MLIIVPVKKPVVGEAWINSKEKRRQDLALLSLVVPAAGAITIVTAAAVLAEDGKNPFFSQPRIGRNGEEFRVYKIRTMDSAEYIEGGGGPGDPRTTRVGKLINPLGIDESPQVLNVASGKMSVVGPRPLVQPDIDLMRAHLTEPEFREWYRAYTVGRPGILSRYANYSHVMGLNADESWYERYECDVAYLEEASSRMDLQIIGETMITGMDMLAERA
jgi:lipopolysaccharide/colanic/teichoic acid biosynthesis glycosyltransferase